MKQKFLKIAVFQVRILAIALLMLIPALIIITAKAEKFYTELWKELGISQGEGKAKFREGFIYGFLYDGGFRNIRNILTGNKIAVVTDLLEYTREYVNSDNFKYDYAKYRAATKPVMHMIPPTESAVRRKYVDAVKVQLLEIKNDMKRTDGDIRRIYEEQYALLERQITDFEDPQSKTVEFIMQNEAEQFKAALNYYCEQVTQWEIDFPEDPQAFTKAKLSEFLQETADVDFDAKTIKISGRKHFEKAAYDLKPSSWKYAYYAGKDITETVREFVKDWVAEGRIEN